MQSFGDLPTNSGRKFLSIFNISEYLIDKCVEKVRNKKPIIVDFLSHGEYMPKDPRDSISGFLLTMAQTGSPTAARDIATLFRRYNNNIEQLLYGDLNTIYKRVVDLDKNVKRDSRNGLFVYSNSFKLYNGLNEPHYNQKGTKVRSAKVEKKAPPIYASFSETGTSFLQENFFIEPDGIYLLEDSAQIWSTYKKKDLFKTFDKKEWGGFLRLEHLEQLHKLYGIHKDKEYYDHGGDEKKIFKLNMELMKFNDIRSSPLFAYKMKRSFFIPNRNRVYRVSELIDGITKLIKTELLKRGVTETPVIFFTFLQCKIIEDQRLIDKQRKRSDALNIRIRRKIGKEYKNYVSPETLTKEGTKDLELEKSLKEVNRQYQIQKKKLANKTRKAKKDLCKDLVEIDCKNIPECVFIEAGKIKKCVSKANVKGKTQKKPRAKGAKEKAKGKANGGVSECKGLPEAECKLPKCMYTRGKRKYCRKAGKGKKTMAKSKTKANVAQPNVSQANVAQCKGLSKTECKEPRCKYTEGKKRQFCRKAKNERK
jgi:hypothetical protein